jgi:hypothetical protein
MKLTALFTARRGRNFLASLSAREGRNYQFDFLRPTHSLFGFFNRLVEQYTKVLHPSKDVLEQLRERSQEGGRWKTLELARRYAMWERIKHEKDKKRQDDQEAERSELCCSSLALHLHHSTSVQLHLPRLSGTITPLFRLSNSLQLTQILSSLLQ